MKYISRLTELESYGIEPLTGEACGLGLRLLCDVTERGKQIISKAFGIPNINLPAAWNRGSSTSPHVGSIMLDPDDYLFLGIFALLEYGVKHVLMFKPRDSIYQANRDMRRALKACLTGMTQPPQDPPDPDPWEAEKIMCAAALETSHPMCILSPYTVYGVEYRDQDNIQEYLESAKRDGWTYRSFAYRGTASDRNVHEMTQRIQ